jgi:BASS family bile acid:Na+ symporter
MTIAELIPVAINLSMGLIVLGLGLGASFAEASYLLRRPGLLARSIAAMNVVMLAFAALVAAVFELDIAIEVALGALALSPVPPILPNKQTKAGGTAAYIVSLLAIAAICSIVIVPLGVHLFGLFFGDGREVPASAVLTPVLASVVVPLLIGLVAHQLMPAFAERSSRYVAIAGAILLVLAFLPVLVTIWPALMGMVGNGTLVILALFTLVGVAVGHFLGGPDEDNRSVLALATGTRHPGVALAIAAATFPEEKTVIAVVLWHLVVGAIVSGPYVKWRQRAHAADHAESLS